MGRWTVAVSSGFLAVLLVAAPLFDQEFETGDRLELMERDIHILAHPAPSDNSVSFRFTSGSTGTILSVDPVTGWLELQGEPLGGGEDVGWIIDRYIAGAADEDTPPPGDLAAPTWCPEKASATLQHPGRLRLATWNLGNLNDESGESTYTGRDPSVKRSPTDYARIRCYVRLFQPRRAGRPGGRR